MTVRAPAPNWSFPAGEVAIAPAPSTTGKARGRVLDSVRLDEVQEEDSAYLWYPYIPAGKLTVLEGDPGLGKSWITCAITTAVTRGDALPGAASGLPPQNVLMASAEDGIADTIVPRLKSLGADMHRVFAIKERFILNHEGVANLKESMRSFAATIVFIDPIVAYLGSQIDMHRANEVREVMKGMADSAAETGCATVLVRHLRKGGATKGKAIYAGIGSIDFTAAARSVLSVSDEDGTRILRHVKTNGPKGPALSYEFDNADPIITVGEDGRYRAKAAAEGNSFHWGHFLTPEAGGAGAKRKTPTLISTNTRSVEARTFLVMTLAAGKMYVTDIEKLAVERGISLPTLRRIRSEVAISIKDASDTGKWWWELKSGVSLDS